MSARGSNQPVSDDEDHTPRTDRQRAPHLSVVPSTPPSSEPAATAPRRERRVPALVGAAILVVAVIAVVVGVIVVRGDSPSPEPARAPTQRDERADHAPQPPVTTGPVDQPQDHPQQDQPDPKMTPTTAAASPRTQTTTPPSPATPDPGPHPGPAAPPGPHVLPNTPAPPVTQPPATAPPAPDTAQGTVTGCDAYGNNCSDNPLYAEVPPPGYDYVTFPKVATVANGTTLTARCWATGGVTYNYAAGYDPPDYGPDPYESNVYFNVRAPNGQWAWAPDTYFVRDKTHRLGLDEC